MVSCAALCGILWIALDASNCRWQTPQLKVALIIAYSSQSPSVSASHSLREKHWITEPYSHASWPCFFSFCLALLRFILIPQMLFFFSCDLMRYSRITKVFFDWSNRINGFQQMVTASVVHLSYWSLPERVKHSGSQKEYQWKQDITLTLPFQYLRRPPLNAAPSAFGSRFVVAYYIHVYKLCIMQTLFYTWRNSLLSF